MKKSISSLATIALLTLCLPVATHAATQVYDLKTDWSDTQNPNGPWSYRRADGVLLSNDPFPWVIVYSGHDMEALTKTTPASAVPGYLEAGDISAISDSGVDVRWTAPANGTINVSGAIWNAAPDAETGGYWTLTRNGSYLSDGFWISLPRSAPYQLSSGSGGANGLLNIPVQAGDQVDLNFFDSHFSGFTAFGINLTVTFTPDSLDPVGAIEALATTVVQMNLQNGIENSLDSKLDAALKALTDVNVSNDGAACNSLASFINAVEAQRGNKLTNTQADQLIASAHEIQTLLNCGN